ncbi:hypothetical protein KC345_g6520 [Hortaea werneckii]|nr:hypothetical protein KC345_g6520 [Hortaea werneckii]
MGRLATSIAAAAADADNMPSTEKLPSVSIIDALLPRRLASIGSPSSKEKPTDPNIGRKTYVTYYDVRKGKNGSKSIVAHKSASPSAASGNGKGGANAQGGETFNSGRKAQDGGGQSGKQMGADGNKASEFAEEDAKLKELKDTNTSWKDIAEQMNRPVQELKTRWGQINPKANEQKQQQQGKGNGKGKQNQQNNQQGKQGGKPQTKEQEEAAAKKREERQKRREEASKPTSLAPAPAASTKPASSPVHPKNPTTKPTKPAANLPVTTNAADTGDETRFTLSEWLTLQSDSLFTISELQFLSEIIMRDQNQTWLRIASIFYDKTGRKVHPEDIREKFERMAGME